MTKQERIIKKLDKNLVKRIEKDEHYSVDRLISDGKRWIRAIKDGRMICSIPSVSQSGMSRTMKFVETSRTTYDKRYHMLNFFAFMSMLGYQKVRDSNCFRIHGCGMDMVFDTNYQIIHELHSYGFINRKTCDYLAQQVPSVI